MQKVSDFIDIEAPCSEVFSNVAAIERRMQLSPLWGLNALLNISPDFPRPGSSYRIRVRTDVPFGIAGSSEGAIHGTLAGLAQVLALKMGQNIQDLQQQQVDSVNELEAQNDPPQISAVDNEQEYFVQAYEPPNRISYALDADCKTVITWKLQSIPRGTRLSYEEVFCPEMISGEDFLPTVRHVVHEWLQNIKRYSELRGSRWQLFLKGFLDRFFLRLRPDQRRVVLLILFMQALALVMFMVAAIGLAIAGLIL
jgi:hypothetical protein